MLTRESKERKLMREKERVWDESGEARGNKKREFVREIEKERVDEKKIEIEHWWESMKGESNESWREIIDEREKLRCERTMRVDGRERWR